jgi:hypothetical protein
VSDQSIQDLLGAGMLALLAGGTQRGEFLLQPADLLRELGFSCLKSSVSLLGLLEELPIREERTLAVQCLVDDLDELLDIHRLDEPGHLIAGQLLVGWCVL